MLLLEKFTIGMGDRFAHQAKAQLQACVQLANDGVDVVPVWNKSNREHSFIGSTPQSVFDAAKLAVNEIGWSKGWHVDADHINMSTVDRYIECSDFFTILSPLRAEIGIAMKFTSQFKVSVNFLNDVVTF